MAPGESEFDRITDLLGQCLGRIDEQALRLQADADGGGDDGDAADRLEHDLAALQELVDELVDRSAAQERCNLNRIVDAAVSSCLQELGTPILVRQHLAPHLPAVGCAPGQLGYAVQRALMIAASRLEAGGELVVTTRRDGDGTVLELESSGGQRDRHLRERTETLCEFVAGFRGHCRVDHDERGHLLVVIELPEAVACDER